MTLKSTRGARVLFALLCASVLLSAPFEAFAQAGLPAVSFPPGRGELILVSILGGISGLQNSDTVRVNGYTDTEGYAERLIVSYENCWGLNQRPACLAPYDGPTRPVGSVQFECNIAAPYNCTAVEAPYLSTYLQSISSSERGWRESNGECTGEGLDWLGCKARQVLGGIGAVIIYFATALIVVLNFILSTVFLGVGLLYNLTMQNFVLHMGEYINGAAAEGVRAAWTIMRDIANIGIIAGLVATAIGTILGSEKWGAGKSLARILIAALLVNFSYLFAGAIIDAANFATAVLHREFYAEYGLFDTFMELTQPHRVMTFGTITVPNLSLEAAMNALVKSILMFFIILSAIGIFITIIGLLVARFIVLIFLLVTSPIGIAGKTVPFLNSYADDWWKAMFSQAFFAPVFVLISGISFLILKRSVAFLSSTSNVSFTYVTTTGTRLAPDGVWVGMMGTIITFMMGIGFLILAIRTAKELSAKAERFKDIYAATDKYFSKPVSGITRWAGAFAIRNTAGRVADTMRISYKEWAAANNVKDFGKKIPMVGGAVNGMANAFDRRFQGFLDKTSSQKILGFEGFKPIKEARRAREIDLGEEGKKERMLGRGGFHGKEALKEDQDRYRELAQQRTELQDRKRALEAARAAGVLTPDQQNELDAVNANLGGLEREWKQQHIWNSEYEWTNLEGEHKHGRGAFGYANMKLDELKKQYEAGKKGRSLDADGNIIDLTETDDQYWERQKARGELGRVRGEFMTQYRDRLEVSEGIGYQEAAAGAENILGSLPHHFYEDEYYKDPESVIPLAPFLKEEDFLAFIKDDKKARHIKDAMWRERRGWYGQQYWDIQQKVDRGEMLEGSPEHKQELGVLYNLITNKMGASEFSEMARSSAPFDNEGHRFEDLRKMPAFWLGSSSTALQQMLDQKVIGEVERALVRNIKATPLDAPSHKEFAINSILGFTDAEHMPNVGGTVSLDASMEGFYWSERAQGRSAKQLAGFNYAKLKERYENVPGNGGVSYEDYQKAVREIELAEKAAIARQIDLLRNEIANGERAGRDMSTQRANLEADEKRVNPFWTEMGNAVTTEQNGLRTAQWAQEARRLGVSEEEIKSVADGMARTKVMLEARQRFQQKFLATVDPIANPEDRERALQAIFDEATEREGEKMFLAYQQIQAEEASADWFPGKTDSEARALLKKMSFHTPATGRGIQDDLLDAASTQDPQERDRLLELILINGSDSLIANFASNQVLRTKYKWPEKNMWRVNANREAQGKKVLPAVFSPEGVQEALGTSAGPTSSSSTPPGTPPGTGGPGYPRR